MKKTSRIVFTVFLAILLMFFLSPPTALAAGSTEVWINNVHLSAASPYWKNGDAPASAGDWNAYFDAVTHTLTLNNAEITNSFAFSAEVMIFADGDLNLVLNGASTLSRTETAASILCGIFVMGALAVSGNGSLDMHLKETVESSTLYGVYTQDSTTVYSGSLSVNLEGVFTHGLSSPFGVLIAGGETEMEINGSRDSALMSIDKAGFRMTGGKFTGTVVSVESTAGVISMGIELTGGEGYFRAQSSSFAVGWFGMNPALHVSGGNFVFAGDTCALLDFLSPGDTVDLRLTNVETSVSEAADGVGKRLWTSDADGRLVGISGSISPFRYVEFRGLGTAGMAPQTGDRQTPQLWAGIALCMLLGAAGLAARLRGKFR